MDYINEMRFETADDLFNFVAPWGSDPGLKGYVFRGHSQESYLLVPSALRAESAESLWRASGFPMPPPLLASGLFNQVQAEFQVLRSFYRLADQRGLSVPLSPRVRDGLVSDSRSLIYFKATPLDTWIPPDLHEAAALAQHYGMPTSLLDWTYDVFVAMYFAFKGAIGKDGNICIWALNKEWISWLDSTERAVGLGFVTPHYSGNPHLNAQKGLFTHLPSPLPHIVAIQQDPSMISLFRQQVDRRPLDVVIKDKIDLSENRNIFTKFILPCSQAKYGCQVLEKLGYDASRIFPGYGGVADQLLNRHQYTS